MIQRCFRFDITTAKHYHNPNQNWITEEEASLCYIPFTIDFKLNAQLVQSRENVQNLILNAWEVLKRKLMKKGAVHGSLCTLLEMDSTLRSNLWKNLANGKVLDVRH